MIEAAMSMNRKMLHWFPYNESGASMKVNEWIKSDSMGYAMHVVV